MRRRKSEDVLASARTLFLAKGYTATTVDDIAGRAGVSKATVYSNYPDKGAVLAALLDQAGAESAAILAGVLAPLSVQGDLERRLVDTIVALARGVLRPEVLQLRRLAIAERATFPDAVAAYFEQGPASSLRLLASTLKALHREGALSVPDADRAAARLAYAAVGPLQDRALMLGEVPPDDEIVRFAGGAARDFLAAHAPPPFTA